MAQQTSPVTLPCKQCGYINEPERVYCHNCGTKLDRSVLPKEDQVPRESADKARNRIRRMANPGSNVVLREAKTLLQVLIYSILLAALIQIGRPPDAVPPVQDGVIARQIGTEIEDALAIPQPRSVTLAEPDINAFMQKAVKEGDSSFLGGMIKFKRAYVVLTPGICHIGLVKSLWGWPLYFGTDYRLEIANGSLAATNVAGNLGRLEVHPLLMNWLDSAFQGLWTALHREREHLNQMQSIIIEKGKIVLITRGAQRK